MWTLLGTGGTLLAAALSEKLHTRHRHIHPLKILSMDLREIYGDHWSLTGKNVPPYHLMISKSICPVVISSFSQDRGIFAYWAALLQSPRHHSAPILSPMARRSFWHMQDVLSEGMAAPLSGSSHFRQMSKKRSLGWAGDLPLELTFSCICPKDRLHCGECGKCAERIRGLSRRRHCGSDDVPPSARSLTPCRLGAAARAWGR